MHSVEQITIIDKKQFHLVSEANGEDNCLYDTEVCIDGEYIGTIEGGNILNFIVKCATPNLHSLYFTYNNPKEVIKEFLI